MAAAFPKRLKSDHLRGGIGIAVRLEELDATAWQQRLDVADTMPEGHYLETSATTWGLGGVQGHLDIVCEGYQAFESESHRLGESHLAST